MKGKRVAFGFLIATIGLLGIIGAAGASIIALPAAQEEPQESTKGWLGMVVVDVNERTKAHFDISVEAGAVVARLADDGAGAQAGLRVGDVVTAVNDQAVSDSAALLAAMGGMSPGDEVTLTVKRGDETLTLTATLGEQPEPVDLPALRFDVDSHGWGGAPFIHSMPPELRNILGKLHSGNILHGEFQILNRDGEVVAIAITSGQVVTTTETTLEIARKDDEHTTFDVPEDARVLVGGREIFLSGLKPETPVVVVEVDGSVRWVLAWPRDYRMGRPLPKVGHGRMDFLPFDRDSLDGMFPELEGWLEADVKADVRGRLEEVWQRVQDALAAQQERFEEQQKRAKEEAQQRAEDREGRESPVVRVKTHGNADVETDLEKLGLGERQALKQERVQQQVRVKSKAADDDGPRQVNVRTKTRVESDVTVHVEKLDSDDPPSQEQKQAEAQADATVAKVLTRLQEKW